MTLCKTGKIRLGGGFHSLRRIEFTHAYDDIISMENLLEAWKEFVKGKRSRKDVQEFERDLMSNIISLHTELAAMTYEHLEYEFFRIYDPKQRDIHKASVRDRVLHRALYRKLYSFFDKKFIADSWSCRLDKGTHKAVDRFRSFAYKASRNHTRTAWVLKCDIRKFFASIDQKILIELLGKYIPGEGILSLISKIVGSFSSADSRVGLPLGNLTSQLFVNIYMNEFDQFVKHKLKARYYIRYADDFAILSDYRKWLLEILPCIQEFLSDKLKLRLHPNKVSIRTIASGVDYLGWINFPDHRIVRTATKKRMFRQIQLKKGKEETVQSYLGLVSHGNSEKIKKNIKDMTDSLSVFIPWILFTISK